MTLDLDRSDINIPGKVNCETPIEGFTHTYRPNGPENCNQNTSVYSIAYTVVQTLPEDTPYVNHSVFFQFVGKVYKYTESANPN